MKVAGAEHVDSTVPQPADVRIREANSQLFFNHSRSDPEFFVLMSKITEVSMLPQRAPGNKKPSVSLSPECCIRFSPDCFDQRTVKTVRRSYHVKTQGAS
jgi:hypothetical protein